ncbi:hypothetical protein DSO57_1007877 [Entomophthora muscae]|uniref:Uncharacterized protein n=1 Tax=Entomophthora muscae TaxID=34485 RepID=A0ACC2SKL8_9FUNG|nr:hypothetical protein DSO57_1007877 [Entomophthora muscae]
MRYFYILLLCFILFLSTAYAQDDEEAEEPEEAATEVGQGKGKVANTDTSKYAGLYEFTYYYNPNRTTAKQTAQLKCENVTGFTLDIPEAGGVDVTRDFSNAPGEKDPVYGTQQGTWVVKELATGSDFDTLKLNIFINDYEDTLVCWVLKKSGNNIIINLNPNNASVCPTRYIPTTKTCLRDYAFLEGKCKSGPCTGDGSKGRTEKAKKEPDSHATALAKSSLAIAVSLLGFYLI